ncbi:prolyl 4-hydroxylase subunit alpha-2-like [Triplophysa dalaica]|uniref:prolyl 4-hydroxylase subunit alpha-2-like n=1 Tax=Triplophysa dalaica TaxID=1582913 RepID=UPI0024DFF764|nr:prolyl 4-hydroxylase subunit alpha-2-like [Triplophysa dalaica]
MADRSEMAIIKLLAFVACVWIGSPADSERQFYSSMDQVMHLVDEEKYFLKLVSSYIKTGQGNLTALKSNLQTLKRLSDSEDPEKTMSDPVVAYKLIRRLVVDWPYITESTRIREYKDYQEWLRSDPPRFPTWVDVMGAALGLIKLQDIYKLYPEDIIRGSPVNVDEAFCVGSIADQHHKYQHAFHWYLYGLRMLNHPELLLPLQGVTKKGLLEHLGLSARAFGSPSVALDFYHQLLDFMPCYGDPTNPWNELFTIALRPEPTRIPEPDIYTLYTTSSNSYKALCRGDLDQRTSRRQRTLSCRYSTGGGNPRLILAPLKEEIEWDEPQIIRYHDIISDTEIEALKNIARPQLSRPEANIPDYLNVRVFQSVFLTEDNIVVDRVNQRISDATGLSTETAEPLHVQNYGIGGRDEPSHDTLDAEKDRIATFLTYMSDVDKGGATVFPKIGVALKPKKGSAVFWYKFHKNGTIDPKTQHVGCPVLLGNKWVANKWIHEFGQEFTRHCSLSEWE